MRSYRIRPSRIYVVILHVTGANIDDGKKDRRRKEIVGRLGKEMNDRRDEYVYPCPPSLSHAFPSSFYSEWHAISCEIY
jgi:hypothetical protein